jgi:hypothetical protein
MFTEFIPGSSTLIKRSQRKQIMKQHSKLPDYLIDDQGNVFNKATSEKIPLVKGQYVLKTAEEFTTSRGKKICLIRRLTPDEIKSYFKTSTDYIKHIKVDPIDDKTENGYTHTIKVDINKNKAPKTGRGVIIDGVEYDNASKAAKCLKTSVNTVINRCKNNKFKNYNFL